MTLLLLPQEAAPFGAGFLLEATRPEVITRLLVPPAVSPLLLAEFQRQTGMLGAESSLAGWVATKVAATVVESVLGTT